MDKDMLMNAVKKWKVFPQMVFFSFFCLFIHLSGMYAEGMVGYKNCNPYTPPCPVYDPYSGNMSDEYGAPQCGTIGPAEYAYFPPDPNCGIIGPVGYWYSPSFQSWNLYVWIPVNYLAKGYTVVRIEPTNFTVWGYPVYNFYFENPNAQCPPEGQWQLVCCVQSTDYLALSYPVVAKKLHPYGAAYYDHPVYWFYFQGLNYTSACTWKCDEVEYAVDCTMCTVSVTSTLELQKITNVPCSEPPPDVSDLEDNLCTDKDSDGHYTADSCRTPNDDCNDSDPVIYGGAAEICDSKDNNCDGQVDEGCICIDTDGDGFTNCNGDCNNNNAAINSAAPEVCDGIDNNCNNLVDDTCNGGADNCTAQPNNTDMGSSANLASGNLYNSQTVLQTMNTGLRTEFVLSYNSFDTTTIPLGRGWTYSHNINITEYWNRLVLLEGDGRRVYFSNSGANTYSPESSSGRHSTITKNPDGSYTLTEKEGTIYSFDTKGRLAAITDRNNNAVSLAYTGDELTLI
ncbi:MAG: putative metal-binding motif-containing protein, partial [Nitrospirae bacterium]|nr:putative metal-binding motif-containing protein [Nitrospirota bacterium]